MEQKDSGYCQRAAEARAEAVKMRDPVARRTMLEVASNYDQLAVLAEKRRAREKIGRATNA